MLSYLLKNDLELWRKINKQAKSTPTLSLGGNGGFPRTSTSPPCHSALNSRETTTGQVKMLFLVVCMCENVGRRGREGGRLSRWTGKGEKRGEWEGKDKREWPVLGSKNAEECNLRWHGSFPNAFYALTALPDRVVRSTSHGRLVLCLTRKAIEVVPAGASDHDCSSAKQGSMEHWDLATKSKGTGSCLPWIWGSSHWNYRYSSTHLSLCQAGIISVPGVISNAAPERAMTLRVSWMENPYGLPYVLSLIRVKTKWDNLYQAYGI